MPGSEYASSCQYARVLNVLLVLTMPGFCNIAIYADHTTLYSKCDRVSDLWQQLQLASELESDLRETVDWE